MSVLTPRHAVEPTLEWLAMEALDQLECRAGVRSVRVVAGESWSEKRYDKAWGDGHVTVSATGLAGALIQRTFLHECGYGLVC